VYNSGEVLQKKSEAAFVVVLSCGVAGAKKNQIAGGEKRCGWKKNKILLSLPLSLSHFHTKCLSSLPSSSSSKIPKILPSLIPLPPLHLFIQISKSQNPRFVVVGVLVFLVVVVVVIKICA